MISGANVAYHHASLQHTASDYYIMLRITNAIANDVNLSNRTAIGVTSFSHIVLITGQAETPQLRQRVINIAKNTPNVIHVYNAIAIGVPLSHMTDAKDTWITTKIKTRLIARNDIEPGTIKVITEDGIVYLMGIVPREQADIAVDLARNTSGVNRVVKIFYYVIMPKIN
jgi:osmotically-inducible protein OsmY